MAQRLAELCSVLVENAYGELAAQIFSTIVEYGRMSLVTLHQYTRLPIRRIKTGLATLIQHHILLHYTADEDSPTFFQVDWNAAYALVRTRKITRLVSEGEGEAAGKLVANVLQLGHASVGDLVDAYDLTPASKRDSGIDTVEEHMTEEGLINGISKDSMHMTNLDKISTVSDFHRTIRSLLDKGYLTKVGQRSYVPQPDLEEQLRDTVIAEQYQFRDGRVTGPKKKLQFDAAVNTLKRKWEDEDSYSKSRDVASRGMIKRSKASPSSSKRVRLNGDLPNGVHCMSEDEDEDVDHSVQKLPNDMVVRVNYAKCTTIFRSQRLERMVSRFLGPVTAAVYGALLQSLEHTSKVKVVLDKLKSDEDDIDDEEDMLPFALDTKVLDNLDNSIDLASTIKATSSSHKLPNGVGSHRNKPQVLSDDPDEAVLGIKVEKNSDDEADDPSVPGLGPLKERNKRLQLLDMHLRLLAEHPKRFCIRHPNTKETRVNVAALTKTLIQAELDTMINARFGKVSTRVVRMLREKGKLEEKQIATMSMMRIKDVRAVLTNLQFHGITDVQELPKDNRRQPSSTLYLWFLDEQQVGKLYLQQTYHAMARALQRVKVERDGKFKAVIEKAERADVKGREQELLNWQEKELLKEWREVEERLLVQIARMDDVVAILRDFSGNDTTL